MDLVKIVCKCYMIFVGFFFIAISLDVFSATHWTFWKNMVDFLELAAPGIVIIILTIIFRKKETILGLIAFVFALLFFVYAQSYEQFLTQFSLVLMVEVPTVLTGAILVMWGDKQKRIK